MKLLFIPIAILILVGCSPAKKDYSLSSLSPSPVSPGMTVTAFGLFPENPQVYLGDVLLSTTPVPNGLSFKIPESTVAGMVTLKVTGVDGAASGILQIIPRIDGVTLNDEIMTIKGAGWPAQPKPEVSVEVDFDGVSFTPEVSSGSLSVPLSETFFNGLLLVYVRVNGQVSQGKTVLREAGAVKGKVVFPASESVAISDLSYQVNLNDLSLTSIIVYQDVKVSHHQNECSSVYQPTRQLLEGLALSCTQLIAWQSSSELGATRLDFANPEEAFAVFKSLKSKGKKVEWDIPVTADGLEAQSTTPQGKQWHLDLIGVDQAWLKTKGQGVVVAVVDTGVDLDHPDLMANLLPGHDFIDNDMYPMDIAGHGTHVAGLIAANGQVSGTAPEAKLLPVRVLEGLSGGSSFTVAQGILWAAGLGQLPNPNPAQVINLSLGSNSYSDIMAEAVNKVLAKGVVVVAATGNDSGPVAYPAALPDVVSVTALAGPKTAYQPWYANKGIGTIITAYGGDSSQDQDSDGVSDGILSTDLNGYSIRNGTSMASPQVAGLAALAVSSSIKSSLVSKALSNTATELGVMGYDHQFGYGLASGRMVSISIPRIYVLALQNNTIATWTLVQDDLSFQLNNLSSELSVIAASDDDGDGILAEAGEMRSNTLTQLIPRGQVLTLSDLQLTIADGSNSLSLEAP
jgi:hypothetical protein